jgi:hypothetical protein
MHNRISCTGMFPFLCVNKKNRTRRGDTMTPRWCVGDNVAIELISSVAANLKNRLIVDISCPVMLRTSGSQHHIRLINLKGSI